VPLARSPPVGAGVLDLLDVEAEVYVHHAAVPLKLLRRAPLSFSPGPQVRALWHRAPHALGLRPAQELRPRVDRAPESL